MTNRLKMEVRDIVQETGIKTILKKKKCKKAKWLSEVTLQIAVKRREVKSKGEKEGYSHLNAEKAFLSNQYKEIEENNRMGKTRDLFKKSRDTKGTFHVLKRKLQHFGHLMQSVYSFEKTLMLGRTGGRRRRGQQRMRWLDGITDSMDMSLG